MRGLIWTTVVFLFLLLLLGNIVSITGAGLACPDWPLCHGKVIPPLEPKVLLEYTHRLFGLITSILIIFSGIRLWLTGKRLYRVITLVVLTLLVVQVPLGGVVVLTELKPVVTSIHLVIALLIITLFYTSALGIHYQSSSLSIKGKFPLVMLVLVILQSYFGALVRHTGAILACPDFPLCFGSIIPSNITPLIEIHLLHRFFGFALLMLSFFLIRYNKIGKITFLLIFAQVLLGGLIVLTKRNLTIVSLHYANIVIIMFLLVLSGVRFVKHESE